MKAKSRIPKVSHGLMNAKVWPLLATTLLVISSFLLCITGPLMAQTLLATVPVNANPSDVGVNNITNKIYVPNSGMGNGNTVSVINGAMDTVTATVTVGNDPNTVGVNIKTNKIYVTNGNSDTVSVINGATDTVAATVAVGSNPTDLDINTKTNKIYVANTIGGSSISVIDGATDTLVADVPVGFTPFAVNVNPTTNKIYAASIDDVIHVIDGATNTVVATVAANFDSGNPHSFRVNPATNKIYVANSGGDAVTVIDGATNSLVSAIPIGNTPYSVGINSKTDKIYVQSVLNDTKYVSVIDGATDTVVATLPVAVGVGLIDTGISETTNKIYVASTNAINVIDGATNTVLQIVSTADGLWPCAFGVNSTTSKIYAANLLSNNVSVIGKAPVPTTTSLNPAYMKAGEAGFNLTVNGTGFIGSSVVRWNGSNRTTTYVSPKQLVASIPASDIASPGTASVTVYTPDPEVGTSNPQTFTILDPLGVVVSSITPTSGAKTGAVNVKISGSGFTAGSGTGAGARLEQGYTTVINGTSFLVSSDTLITCTFDLTSKPLGKYDVVVRNPAGKEGRLSSGFSVTNACGQGTGASISVLAAALGLLSLAGLGHRRKRH